MCAQPAVVRRLSHAHIGHKPCRTPTPVAVAPGSEAALVLTLRVSRCDALGLPASGLTDDYEPLLRFAVTGVAGEQAQLVANFGFVESSVDYLAAKHRLLAKQCPLQVHDD